MHNPESILKNLTYKNLWDFKIQSGHLISARQTYQVIIKKEKKKRTCKIVNFAELQM